MKHRSFVPRMDIVGLPDAAVQESKQRVQAAIKNAKLPASLLYAFFREKRVPRKRLVGNLAPATVREEGQAYVWPAKMRSTPGLRRRTSARMRARRFTLS